MEPLTSDTTEQVIPVTEEKRNYLAALRESRIALLIVVATGTFFSVMFRSLSDDEVLAAPTLMFLVVPTLGLQIVVWLMFVRKAQKLSGIEPLRVFLIIPRILEWTPKNSFAWTFGWKQPVFGWIGNIWSKRPRIVILRAGIPTPRSLQSLVTNVEPSEPAVPTDSLEELTPDEVPVNDDEIAALMNALYETEIGTQDAEIVPTVAPVVSDEPAEVPAHSGQQRDYLNLAAFSPPGHSAGSDNHKTMVTLGKPKLTRSQASNEPDGFSEIPLPESGFGPLSEQNLALDQSVDSVGHVFDGEHGIVDPPTPAAGGSYTLSAPTAGVLREFTDEDFEPIAVHAEDLQMAREVYRMFSLTSKLEEGMAPFNLEPGERCFWMDSTMLYHDTQGKTLGAEAAPGTAQAPNAEYVNDGDLVLTDKRLLLRSEGVSLLDTPLSEIQWVDLWKDCGLVVESRVDEARNVVMVTYPLVYLVYLHCACEMAGIEMPVSQRIWRQVEAHASQQAA